jgi:hypothetical protein
MNSQDNSKTKTVISYGIISCILGMYFILDYLLIRSMLSESQKSLKITHYVNLRLVYLK